MLSHALTVAGVCLELFYDSSGDAIWVYCRAAWEGEAELFQGILAILSLASHTKYQNSFGV